MKRRKKLFSILSMVLAVALLLTGCTTGGGVSTTTTAPSSMEDDASLSIYIFTGGNTSQQCYIDEVYSFYSDYKNAIDITIEEFTDASEMESRLQMELAAGQGPDVIMADGMVGLDMMSLAKNGVFYDMTDIIAADETFNDEKYYLSVMKAGQINDRQYIIPLSFTLPTFVFTKTALGEMGIDLDADSTMEVYEKMLAHLKAADTPQVSAQGGYGDTIMALMRSVGKTPVSYETGEVNLNGEEERIIMELGAELFIQWNLWFNQVGNSTNFWLETAKTPITYTNMFTSPFQLQLYYSAHAENGTANEVELFFAPDAEGNYHALVQEFAAVNANAKNPELAWKFLRLILDHNETRDEYTALSLNRNITSGYVRLMTSESGKLNSGLQLEKMPQEYGDQLLHACDTIADASIYQMSPLTLIFTNGIVDYMKNTVTFDTMVEDIQNKVKLYINE